MKKLVLFLTVAVILFSCTPKDQYSIQGTAENMDGQRITLTTYENSNEISDTTVVKDGRFSFKGTQEIPQVYFISVGQSLAESELSRPLLVEPGKIIVDITNKNIRITGTAINDAYQKSLDTIIPLQEKMEEIKDTYNKGVEDSTMNAEDEEKMFAEYEEIFNKVQAERINFIETNLSNPFGEQLLILEARRLPMEKFVLLTDKTSEAFKAKEEVKSIVERVTTYKNTSVGKEFTELNLKDPAGKDIALSDYAGKGKYVLIDFWASWCGPCREEMPTLVNVYKTYKNKNFEIVGVSLDKDNEAWKKGIKDLNITWVQMSDLGYWESVAAQKYAVYSIPQTVLLDPQGIIIERNLRGDDLLKKLAELIK